MGVDFCNMCIASVFRDDLGQREHTHFRQLPSDVLCGDGARSRKWMGTQRTSLHPALTCHLRAQLRCRTGDHADGQVTPSAVGLVIGTAPPRPVQADSRHVYDLRQRYQKDKLLANANNCQQQATAKCAGREAQGAPQEARGPTSFASFQPAPSHGGRRHTTRNCEENTAFVYYSSNCNPPNIEENTAVGNFRATRKQ